MGRRIILLVFLGVLVPVGSAFGQVAFYSEACEAGAIYGPDQFSQEWAIYSLEGEPLAYFWGESVYGFNGKHLGWFNDGVMRNHRGRIVGFWKGALDLRVRIDPWEVEAPLRFPEKSNREMEPTMPVLTDWWATTSLADFLAEGAE